MKYKELAGLFLVIQMFFIALQATAQKTKQEEDFEAGKKIYMSNCEVCHLVGRNLVNPNKEIQNSPIIDDSKKLQKLLSHKNGVMPAFPSIAKNEKHIAQLRAFLEHARQNPSHVEKPLEKKSDNKPSGVKQ